MCDPILARRNSGRWTAVEEAAQTCVGFGLRSRIGCLAFRWCGLDKWNYPLVWQSVCEFIVCTMKKNCEDLGYICDCFHAGPAPAAEPPALRPRSGRIDEQTRPGVRQALERLVDRLTRGDPQSLLRWTCKSRAKLAAALTSAGFKVLSQANVPALSIPIPALKKVALLHADGAPVGDGRGFSRRAEG